MTSRRTTKRSASCSPACSTAAATQALPTAATTYDALDLPLTRTISRNDATVTDTFGYNTRSELTSAQVNSAAYAYDYDNIGNRKTAQENAEEITSYQSNNLNQYTMLSVDALTDFIPDYDADGNQTRVKTSTCIWAITYDAENRPTDFTKVDSSGSTTIHCEYDHMGRRATKQVTTNGNITLHQRYIYRGYLQIACVDFTRAAHPALWLITWDPAQPIATRPLAIQKDATWYTYGWDLTKNICEVYGQHGYIRTAYTYTPYGQVTAEGDITQPIQWSSEYNDSELGLIYYNYRHYNPVDGRWIGRDKIPFHGNTYAYTNNQILDYADYIGLARYKTDESTCTLLVSLNWIISFIGKWDKNQEQAWKIQAKQKVENYFNNSGYECKLKKCNKKEKCKNISVDFVLNYVTSISKAEFNVYVTNDDVARSVRPATAPAAKFRRLRNVQLNKSSLNNQARKYGGKVRINNDLLHEVGHMIGLSHPGKKSGKSSTGELPEYSADWDSLMGVGLKFRIDDFQKGCCSKIKTRYKSKYIATDI